MTPSWESSEPAASGKCLTESELQAFLLGPPSEPQMAARGRHIDACVYCQQRLEPRIDARVRELEDSTAGSEWLGLTDFPVAESSSESVTSRFVIRRFLGRGGAASVFQAWDSVLRRDVALKIPHLSFRDHPAAKARFVIEAQAAARLIHPNQVSLFDTIVTESHCVLISAFVSGLPLHQWLAQHDGDNGVDIETAVRIVCQLADGTAAAHRLGIIHRDLKPSNILLDDSLPSEGLPFTPRITDFGCARLGDGKEENSGQPLVIGSYFYMSPEQARGDRQACGPASDIYSLGAILFELLTGQVPTSGKTKEEALRNAIGVLPSRPSDLRPEVSADLEAICLKCLAKSPSGRYPTAEALRDDLRNVLAGQPVSARPETLWQQYARLLRRHPKLTAGVAIVFVSLATTATVLWYAKHITDLQSRELIRLAAERDTAYRQEKQHAEIAESQRAATEKLLYLDRINRAGEAVSRGDFPSADRLLRQIREHEPFHPAGFAASFLERRTRVPHRLLAKFPQPIYAFDWSSDGRMLAAAGKDARVHLLSYPEGTLIRSWETGQKETNGILFTANDRELWTTGDDGTLRSWDVETGQEVKTLLRGKPLVFDLLPTQKNGWILCTDSEDRCQALEENSGRPLHEFLPRFSRLRSIALSPDESTLYACGSEHSIRVWEVHSGQLIAHWQDLSREDFRSLAVSPDGRSLAAAGRLSDVWILDSSTGKPIDYCPTSDTVTHLVFQSNGDLIFLDQTGAVGRWPRNRQSNELNGERPAVHHVRDFMVGCIPNSRPQSIRIAPSQDSLVVSTQDGGLFKLPLSKLVLRPRQERSLGWCYPVFYTDDETGIVAGNGNELSLLDSECLKTVWRVDGSGDWLLWVVARPGGELLCIEREDAVAGTWLKTRSLLDGSVGWKRQLTSDRITKARVSAFQGRRAAVCDLGEESQLRILSLEAETSPYVRSLPVNSVAWECHPSEATIAIAERGMIRLYDAMSGNVIWASEELTSSLETLIWTPDGGLLVGALDDRRVCVWNGRTGELQTTMGVTPASGARWVFATDGETLLGVDREGTLSAWHPKSGNGLLNLRSVVPADPRGFDIDSQDRLLISPSARPPVMRFD